MDTRTNLEVGQKPKGAILADVFVLFFIRLFAFRDDALLLTARA